MVKQSKYLNHSIFFILYLCSVSCDSTSNQRPPHSSGSNTPSSSDSVVRRSRQFKVSQEVQESCLNRIKADMEKGNFLLFEMPNTEFSEDIQLINQELKQYQFQNAGLKLIYTKGQTGNLLAFMTHFSGEENRISRHIEFLLILALPDIANLFTLRFEVKRKNTIAKTNLILSQRILIKKDCSLQLYDTQRKILTIQDSTYRVVETSIETGGVSFGPKTTQIPLPSAEIQEEEYLENTPEIEELDQEDKNKIYYFLNKPASSFFRMQWTEDQSIKHFNPIRNETENFQGKTFTIKNELENIGSKSFFYSEKSTSFFTLDVDQNEIWLVDKNVWKQTQFPLVKNNCPRTIDSDSATVSRTGQSRIEVYSNEIFFYPFYRNLTAYLDIKKVEILTNHPQGWKFRFTIESHVNLIHQVATLIHKPQQSSHPDLQETPLVQISIPPVQTLIEELLPKYQDLDRLEMANKVFELLQKKLKANPECMAYPLSTEQILKQGKGVCLHFSNLFAALARGVGIPTRIVAGWILRPGGVDSHSWNEIEIMDKVWIPVEPQLSSVGKLLGVSIPYAEAGTFEKSESHPFFFILPKTKFHVKILEQ